MKYPDDFSREARARMVAAKVKAQRDFREAQNDAPPFPLGAVTRYVMSVVSAFCKEACSLARSGQWGVDRVEEEVSKWIYTTILFAESEQGVDGFRFRNLLTSNGMAVKSDILALFRLEPQWKSYEEDLIEISELQGSGHSAVPDSIPIRGHRAEVKTWMRKKDLASVKDAARHLGISESTLKSIMTSKGEIRHSKTTVESVIKKIRATSVGE